MLNWVRYIKFPHKMAAIIVLSMVPVSLLWVFFWRAEQEAIHVAESEIAGLIYFEQVNEILAPVGKLRLLALAAGSAAETRMVALQQELQRIVAAHDQATDGLDESAAALSRGWPEIRAELATLGALRGAEATRAESRYGRLIAQVLALRDNVYNTSQLALDPDPIAYYVAGNAVVAVPDFEAALLEYAAQATIAVNSSAAGSAAQRRLSALEALARQKLGVMVTNIDAAAAGGEAGVAGKVAASLAMASAHRGLDDLVAYVEQRLSGMGGTELEGLNGRVDALLSVIRGEAGLQAMHQRHAHRLLQERHDGDWRHRDGVMITVGLALVLGLSFTVLVTWSTLAALRRAKNTVERLAEGDYQCALEEHGRDELAEILRSLDAMRLKVAASLTEVQESASNVSTAAREIDEGTADLSRRTEQQAANLEETASAVEELASTVKQNADSAATANAMARQARAQAEQSAPMVDQAVAAMGAINASSKKIADIVGVIDEITFQTNLLALNAAVEAARAGDQGRGFAVVASEVRSLAQRSATATKQIKELIAESGAKVADGSRVVGESGAKLREIVGSVHKVCELVGDIAAACKEQSSSTQEISRAVTQMDESTQQNAAMVEQATAAAASMSDQAAKLTQLTALFRLPDSGAPTSRATAARRGRAPIAMVAVHPPGAAGASAERRAATRPWADRKPSTATVFDSALAMAGVPLARVKSGNEDWSEF